MNIYDKYYNSEWDKLIITREEDKSNKQEEMLFNSTIGKVITKNMIDCNIEEIFSNFKIYKHFFSNCSKVYKESNSNKLIIIFYLDKYNCGRFGYIHGGASYFLTYLSSQLLVDSCDYNIVTQKTIYKKKIMLNSNLFTESIKLFDNNNIKVNVKLRDYCGDVCLESEFIYERIFNTKF